MMKAGKYYVGDLCYVMHGQWDEVCKLTIDGYGVLDGEFNLADGTRFAMYSTAYGDGAYRDRDDRKYSVDSGALGCVEVGALAVHELNEAIEGKLGHVIEFAEPFETSGGRDDAWDGVVRFGHVAINTEEEENE